MKIEFEEAELEELYRKAYDGFRSSIDHPDNDFLQEELNFPIETVTTKPRWVRVEWDDDPVRYIIETRLDLISNVGEIFGYYALLEDNDGDIVDDFLVFDDDYYPDGYKLEPPLIVPGRGQEERP